MRFIAFLLFATLFAHTAETTVAPPPISVPAVAVAPVVIDDEKIIDKLEKDGPDFIKDKKTTPFDKLAKQLSRKTATIDLPALTGEARGADDVYRACQPGVLILGLLYKCKECPDWHVSAASAFVLTADGICASNYHVFDPDPDEDIRGVVAMTSDGSLFPVVEVLAGNKTDDVALFRVDTDKKKLTPLPLGTAPQPGARISVISHPAEHFFSYSTGVVSRYAKVKDSDGTSAEGMYVTADFARGSSGAPVFNDKGEVVGIVASTESCYYDDDGKDVQKDLQMVFKACVPVKALRSLFKK